MGAIMKPSKLSIILRDANMIRGHCLSMLGMKWMELQKHTVSHVFDKIAAKYPDKPCFYYEDKIWTYKDVEVESNKIGNFFKENGFKNNEVVSLFMENRPEYVITWLGLSKIGIVTALINYHLKSSSLKHCVETAKSKAIICGTELTSAINDIYPDGSSPIPIFMSGPKSQDLQSANNLGSVIENMPISRPIPFSSQSFQDSLLYCFTSGTTGFPKPAIIKNSRFAMAGHVNHYASKLGIDDLIYNTLPLYHVAGGVLGLSQTLLWGSPMIIRHSFSAKNFWKDCIKYNATSAQYIAETGRFLLSQKPSPEDSTHNVKVMFGNGMRPEIWREFQNRFGVKNIIEYYGSTEGNANLVNFDSTEGSVGIIPTWIQSFYPMTLMKLDEYGNPIRNKSSGLVEKCKVGETGELVGKIFKGSPFRDFQGYAHNKEESQKKIIYNVFRKNDSAFRTGDLFVKDEYGYFYFKDRMGDTFRWKSENVSTAEVEYLITNMAELRDVAVYGVTIPGYDGKAGMATIADPYGTLDLSDLQNKIIKSLAHYSRPVFIRVAKKIEMTETHKIKKFTLAEEGYDLDKISKSDKIYMFKDSKYVPFTEDLAKRVLNKDIRL